MLFNHTARTRIQPHARHAIVAIAAAICRSDRLLMSVARATALRGLPLARTHLDHYLGGSGQTRHVSTAQLLQHDAGVRMLIEERVGIGLAAGRSAGVVRIPQWAFADRDWLCALGGIRIRWRLSQGSVLLGFSKRYRWRADQARSTRRLHEAGKRLELRGARPFEIVGLPCRTRQPPPVYAAAACRARGPILNCM